MKQKIFEAKSLTLLTALAVASGLSLTACSDTNFEAGDNKRGGVLANFQGDQPANKPQPKNENLDETTSADFPEPVSGAYLTCVITPEVKDANQAVGCNVYKDANRTEAKVKAFDNLWTVTDGAGKSIPFTLSLVDSGPYAALLWIPKSEINAAHVNVAVTDANRKSNFTTMPVQVKAEPTAAPAARVPPQTIGLPSTIVPTATPSPSPSPTANVVADHQCVSGMPGDPFWYVKTGGKQTSWAPGTDATCMGSVSRVPVGYGGEGCVFGFNKSACEKNYAQFKEGKYVYGADAP